MDRAMAGEDRERFEDERDFVIARYVLGLSMSEEWVDFACRALVAGFDSPSLRILAGEFRADRFTVEPLVRRTMDELGWHLVSRFEAKVALARSFARRIVSGEMEPLEGLEQFFEALGGGAGASDIEHEAPSPLPRAAAQLKELVDLYYELDDLYEWRASGEDAARIQCHLERVAEEARECAKSLLEDR
jgi:hypothetical protein